MRCTFVVVADFNVESKVVTGENISVVAHDDGQRKS